MFVWREGKRIFTFPKSSLVGYLMPKKFLEKRNSGNILSMAEGKKDGSQKVLIKKWTQ